MVKNDNSDFVTTLSDTMANAVEKASMTTVLVNGRKRLPASGIIMQADLILTADHVVEREEDIQVAFPDGSQQVSKIVGRDPGSDLALLRLPESVSTLAEPASQEPRVGQLVLALGRPTLDGIQASLGVISAVGGPVRTGRGSLLMRYLRTDAIPYPGFSGGTLINTEGKVVGINTSGLARGASLAIPATLAWKIGSILSEHGSLRRGYLGVRSQPVSISAAQQKALGREQAIGLLLVNIEAGSPAEDGGLIVGDILTSVDNHPINDHDDLLVLLSGDLVGKPTPIEVLRGGEPRIITVTIGEH
jgi:S1-C subfamily serine protease